MTAYSFPNKSLRIAIAASRWNSQITDEMVAGAREALQLHGVQADDIDVVRCPGAYELPLAVHYLLEKKDEQNKVLYDGIVAIGAVIRGETPHFDYICQAVAQGLTRLNIDFGRPVAFGVLTTDNVKQALERAGRAKGNKGAEAALAVLDMLQVKFDLGL